VTPLYVIMLSKIVNETTLKCDKNRAARLRNFNDAGSHTPWPRFLASPVYFILSILLELVNFNDDFWAAVRKTVRPMLSDRCNVCLAVCL